MKEILNKCRCCCQGSNTWATQLILKQSTSLHRGANRGSIEAVPHWGHTAIQRQILGTLTLGKGVEVRWQGGAAPLRKQVQ